MSYCVQRTRGSHYYVLAKYLPYTVNVILVQLPSTGGSRSAQNEVALDLTSNCDKTAYIDYETELEALTMLAAHPKGLRLNYRMGKSKLFHI